MVERIRVAVDFNSRTPDGKIVFNETTVEEIEAELGGKLRPGIPLTLHDEELEVEALLEWDAQFKFWTGIPNWYTRRDRLDYVGPV